MSESSSDEDLIITTLLAIKKLRSAKRKRTRKAPFSWVRDLYKEREEIGTYNSLIEKLRIGDREFYFRYGLLSYYSILHNIIYFNLTFKTLYNIIKEIDCKYNFIIITFGFRFLHMSPGHFEHHLSLIKGNQQRRHKLQEGNSSSWASCTHIAFSSFWRLPTISDIFFSN